MLLVEQVDRISRLNSEDWEKLKRQITEKGIIIVSLDLPTSHQFLNNHQDEFTQRMMQAINSMMLDMLAAVARIMKIIKGVKQRIKSKSRRKI